MTSEDDSRSVDRLDVAPRPAGRTVWVLGLGLGLAVLLAATIGLNASSDGSSPGAGSTPVEEGVTSSPTSGASTGADSLPPATVRDGPALVAGVPEGYVVYARSGEAVYRIALGSGVITQTPVDSQTSGGRDALVATQGAVVAVRNDGVNMRRIYRDGQPVELLGGIFSQANQILPGPGGDFWIARGAGWQTTTVTRVGADGEEAGSLDVLGTLAPAGGGELLMEYLGRTWRIGADLEPVKISEGIVRGVGQQNLLIGQCDDDLVCHQSVTDREGTEVRRFEEGPLPVVPSIAEISPDGRWMVETLVNENGDIGGRLVDLRSGTPVRDLPSISPSSYISAGTASGWLPDSAGYLLLAGGRLTLLDPGSGGLTALDVDLPPLLTMTTAS